MIKSKSFKIYKNICSATILFIFCGICGWIYETALTSYVWGRFADRGVLHIPVLPIYGVFAFLMIPLFKKHNNWFTVFFGGMIITTLLELGFSYIIEWVLHRSLWDYSSWDFNFQGRISLYSSIIFGVMSIILIKLVYPLVKKIHHKAPSWFTCFLGNAFAIIFITDIIYTVLLGK